MALLVIDMISDWAYPDAGIILPSAHRISPAIARLRKRCIAHGVPVVFVNDNRGKWRSDFSSILAESRASPAGAVITDTIGPDMTDYAVLKPKHSGFTATLLDLLLRHLSVDRLILSGIEAERCILVTALDALMRDYRVLVASDCIASQRTPRKRAALRYLEDVWAVPAMISSRIALPSRQTPSARTHTA